ncbi:probable mitochondrial-processing peptidase subunit alpha-2, chloroplastic/mitochondrial [Pieris napi]|uniref:probable mitochondrial-processing peptidase subunit alpha-2, chloroplastic/mitochondrial n=1 Tax=Pieris napi TaxID=78633 RepID=UPI001FB908F3|nr:probable mitochondrial-processing peptidase subunit alpha-2, chloroplastic/mitochondrial [Pieris napi]
MVTKAFQSVRQFSRTPSVWNLCWPSSHFRPQCVQRTELLNGIKVAAAKTSGTAVAACTIMFQAGSRFEINDDFGATHFIRAISPASGCAYTDFSKARVLQQFGAHLTCTATRQYIAFTLTCPLPSFKETKYYLLDTAARSMYNEWDIKDCMSHIRDDLYRITTEERVMDLVQRACWAGSLANSIYCEEERVESMTRLRLCGFVYENFKSSSCSVASVGVPFEETLKVADKIEMTRYKPPERKELPSNPRAGFEYYELGPGSDTCIAAVIPGCGASDLTCLLKHAIIAAACGTGSVQSGQHDIDCTPQGPLGHMAGADIHTKFRAFNIAYYDTGVFGILCNTRAQTAKTCTCALVEFLCNVGDLDFRQLEIGKKRLKMELARHDEDAAASAEGLALQLACGVRLDGVGDALALIDNITVDDLSCVAKAISSRRNDLAIAVVGDCGAVPHDQELFHHL